MIAPFLTMIKNLLPKKDVNVMIFYTNANNMGMSKELLAICTGTHQIVVDFPPKGSMMECVDHFDVLVVDHRAAFICSETLCLHLVPLPMSLVAPIAYFPKDREAYAWQQGSWDQHGAHQRPTGPRWAPCWSHELWHLGCHPILNFCNVASLLDG